MKKKKNMCVKPLEYHSNEIWTYEYDILHSAIQTSKANGLGCVIVPHAIEWKTRERLEDQKYNVEPLRQSCSHSAKWRCNVWTEDVQHSCRWTHITWDKPTLCSPLDFETRLIKFGRIKFQSLGAFITVTPRRTRIRVAGTTELSNDLEIHQFRNDDYMTQLESQLPHLTMSIGLIGSYPQGDTLKQCTATVTSRQEMKSWLEGNIFEDGTHRHVDNLHLDFISVTLELI